MSREEWLTPLDRDLLDSIARTGSVAAACRHLGIGRDRGVYHLAHLAELAGAPVVRASRGGSGRGTTRLTELGERLRRTPTGSIAPIAPRPGRLRGRYRAGGDPWVELPGGVRLFVGFSAPDGARVELTFDPESVLLAPARFPSSARNVFRGRIFRMRALNAETIRVELAVGRVRFPALVTPHSVEALHLKVGGHAYLYLKATALRAAGRPL